MINTKRNLNLYCIFRLTGKICYHLKSNKKFRIRISIFKTLINILFIDRQKYAQKVWSSDLVHEKTFRLSSHIPEQFHVMSKTKLKYLIFNSNRRLKSTKLYYLRFYITFEN